MAFRWGEGTLMERLEQWPGAASRLAQRRWCAKDVLPLEGSVGTAGKPLGSSLNAGSTLTPGTCSQRKAFPPVVSSDFKTAWGARRQE